MSGQTAVPDIVFSFVLTFNLTRSTCQEASDHTGNRLDVHECASVPSSPSRVSIWIKTNWEWWLSPAAASWLRTFLFPVYISTISSTCSCCLYESRELSVVRRVCLRFYCYCMLSLNIQTPSESVPGLIFHSTGLMLSKRCQHQNISSVLTRNKFLIQRHVTYVWLLNKPQQNLSSSPQQ